jgi:uncharacterized protein (DUF1778 family)
VSESARQGRSVLEDAFAAEMAERYTAGESIRKLAASTGRSYGTVHRMLTASGVILPGRQARAARRSERLGLRASAEQADLIREAAALEGKTVSSFVMDTATSRAREVISDHRDLVLSVAAFEQFHAELDKPAEAIPELVELFRRQRRAASEAAPE